MIKLIQNCTLIFSRHRPPHQPHQPHQPPKRRMRPRHRGRTWHWSFLCRSVHAILRIALKREEVQHENMGDPWKMGGIHQWMMWMSKHICIVNLDIHWDIAIWYVMNIVVATGCRKWAQTPKTCSWRVVQGGAPKLWAGFYTPLSIDIPTINHRIHHNVLWDNRTMWKVEEQRHLLDIVGWKKHEEPLHQLKTVVYPC